MGLNMRALRQTHVLIEDIIRRLLDMGFHLGPKAKLIDVRTALRKWLKTRTVGTLPESAPDCKLQ